ncbi:hypothetical protein IMZ48_49470 [Candidatus Bathyarchaeota archaeon]|nr:hypothetical protein [Candidatus Bathyarchaeota archaeon]
METTKLAVIIDADNSQPSAISPLLAEVTKHGTTFVRRAYDDWTNTSLRGWSNKGSDISVVYYFTAAAYLGRDMETLGCFNFPLHSQCFEEPLGRMEL